VTVDDKTAAVSRQRGRRGGLERGVMRAIVARQQRFALARGLRLVAQREALRRLGVHGAHPDGFHPLRLGIFEALRVDDEAADREADGDGHIGRQGEELVGVPVGHEP